MRSRGTPGRAAAGLVDAPICLANQMHGCGEMCMRPDDVRQNIRDHDVGEEDDFSVFRLQLSFHPSRKS